MDKIGNKDLVYKGQFIVPEKEEVYFETHIEGWLVKIKIIIEDLPEKKSELKVEPEGDILKIHIVNWNNSLGTATITPFKIGQHSNGKPLYFMLTNYAIGKTNLLSIQLLLGGNNEK